jgi:hypothetical protein
MTAILSRRCGISLGNYDVHINIAGGIGVEQTGGCGGRGTKYCCKIPTPSTVDPDFYYDFGCSLAMSCEDRYTPEETDPRKKAVTQPNMIDTYCNL